MSSSEKALLKRIEQLEGRMEAMEHQLQEQRQKLEKVEHQGPSVLPSHSQQQYQEALCSVDGCSLLAVATCEHGVDAMFSKPCKRQICIRHVKKRLCGIGSDGSIQEYCPKHA